MDITIQIDRAACSHRRLGDFMRFDAQDEFGDLLVDMGMLQWTILRDAHVQIDAALDVVERLATHDGVPLGDQYGQRILLARLPRD